MISAKCDYACKAVLELSSRWPNNNPVQVTEIAEKHDMPMKYLPQILAELRRAGIVESIRGNQGGYILGKSPQEITLGQVIKASGGSILASNGAGGKTVFTSIWSEVEDNISNFINSITFEDILTRIKGIEKLSTYQI